jgi:UDP:flavonoid glycosyltransferase YjiC (YdhE family)
MPRFLFCTYGASGHIHPMIPTAQALLARGHEVGFLTSSAYRESLEHLGFRYFEPAFWTANLSAASVPAPSRNPIRNVRGVLKFADDFSFPQGERQIRDLERVRAAWPFDVLVNNDMVLGAAPFAERTGCVWATHGAFLSCPLPGPGIPAWGMGLPLPHGPLARLRNAVAGLVCRGVFGLLAKRWEKFRAAQGLPPKHVTLAEHVLSPYLYIIPSVARFDYSREDLPPQVHYVGPCLWAEPSTVEDWVPDFPHDYPIVYCTAGTVADSLAFIKTFIAAVDGKQVNLFATLGKQHSPAALGALPENVKVTQYMPQKLVLRHVDAVICNGGSGATMAAVLAGKPMVIIPMISDQPENARRWERLGVAKTLKLGDLNVVSAWSLIRAVISDPQLRARAEELGRAFARVDGPAQGASLLEALANTLQPVRRPDTSGRSV